MSRDPVDELGGICLYTFAQNDGVGLVDILGETCKTYEGTWRLSPDSGIFLRTSVCTSECPEEIEASVFLAYEWQPPRLRRMRRLFGRLFYIEAGIHVGVQGKAFYSECSGLKAAKVCGRGEFFLRVERRLPGFRDGKGRFTRLRFGGSAEGGAEVCLDFCSGAISIEGTFTYSFHANFGNKYFNRSYEWGDARTIRGNLGTIPSLAIMKDYCNKQPTPDSCCCLKK